MNQDENATALQFGFDSRQLQRKEPLIFKLDFIEQRFCQTPRQRLIASKNMA
jgi:hypothetical protein